MPEVSHSTPEIERREEERSVERSSVESLFENDRESFWREQIVEHVRNVRRQQKEKAALQAIKGDGATEPKQIPLPANIAQLAAGGRYIFSEKRSGQRRRALERTWWKWAHGIEDVENVQEAVDCIETLGKTEDIERPPLTSYMRKYLDESILEHPAKILGALQVVGVQFRDWPFSLFPRRRTKAVEESDASQVRTMQNIMVEARGFEDVLYSLGEIISWQPLESEQEIVQILPVLGNHELLASFRNEAMRNQLAQLMSIFSTPRFDQLPVFERALANPKLLKFIPLAKLAYDEYGGGYSHLKPTVGVLMAGERLEEKGILDAISVIEESGISIDRDFLLEIARICNMSILSPEKLSQDEIKEREEQLNIKVESLSREVQNFYEIILAHPKRQAVLKELHQNFGIQFDVRGFLLDENMSMQEKEQIESIATALYMVQPERKKLGIPIRVITRIQNNPSELRKLLDPEFYHFLHQIENWGYKIVNVEMGSSALATAKREPINRDSLYSLFDASREVYKHPRFQELLGLVGENGTENKAELLVNFGADFIGEADFKRLFSLEEDEWRLLVAILRKTREFYLEQQHRIINLTEIFDDYHEQGIKDFLSLSEEEQGKILELLLESSPGRKFRNILYFARIQKEKPKVFEMIQTVLFYLSELTSEEMEILASYEDSADQVREFIQWAFHANQNNRLLTQEIFFIIDYRDVVRRLVGEYKIPFTDCVHNFKALPIAEELLFAPDAPAPQFFGKVNYQFQLQDAMAIKNFFQAVDQDDFLLIRDRYHLSFSEGITNPSFINFLSKLEKGESVKNEEMDSMGQQLNWAQAARLFIDTDYQAFDRIAQTPDDDAEKPSDVIRKFVEKYPASDKGKTIAVLAAAREFLDEDAPSQTIKRTCEQLKFFSSIIDRYDVSRAPLGIRASIGMEYEVTRGIVDGFQERHPFSPYKKSVQEISKHADVGQGVDALHEFATTPTDNPYLLLLELQLLQDLDFFDFNFEHPGYDRSSRGMHLTIGGERGCSKSVQANFLQNALVISGWGGMNVGYAIDRLSGGRGTQLRLRPVGYGLESHNFFIHERPSVEMRALSIDRWEPLERTILTSFYGAMAIQAVEEYCASFDPLDIFSEITEEQLQSPQSLLNFLKKKKILRKKIEGTRVQSILFEWFRLQVNLVNALRDHNENFVANETQGYEDSQGRWIEPSDFGGEHNAARFESILHSNGMSIPDDVERYLEGLKLSNDFFFTEVFLGDVNTLTRIANLFVKPPMIRKGATDDRAANAHVNAFAALKTTKIDAQHIEEADSDLLKQSVFTRTSEPRRGYYAFQGGSDRLLMHRVQICLMNFLRNLQNIIETHGVEEKILKRAA